ncbi:MAG: hypothetical protein U0446_04310 [Dehalococcoidia bacterium]
MIIRDFRLYCYDEDHARRARCPRRRRARCRGAARLGPHLPAHRRGKIEVNNKVHIRTMAELAHVYTPGVARVSQIHDNPDAVWSLTIKAKHRRRRH